MSENHSARMLQGQRVVVTGGGQGLGLAIAQRLAENGSSVTLVDLDGEAATRAAALLPGDGHHAVKADVADESSCQQAVADSVELMGGVDVLVNNAGIQLHAAAEVISMMQWQKVLGVNLTGVLSMSQCVARHLIETRKPGSIVNIGSLNALFGMPGRTIYGTAKTAVLGLTRNLAVDWARYGIRVNAICPGYHRTPLYEKYAAAGKLDEQRILGHIPMRRLGSPDDIANAALFLASPMSSYMTGQPLVIDGGYSVYGAAEDAPQ